MSSTDDDFRVLRFLLNESLDESESIGSSIGEGSRSLRFARPNSSTDDSEELDLLLLDLDLDLDLDLERE